MEKHLQLQAVVRKKYLVSKHVYILAAVVTSRQKALEILALFRIPADC